ncbi:MAG: hypothetical protein MAG453_01868 [Calditrichaeota bacterium]|nr:hypothetical protein [Calditrichota bacterium]
MNRVNVEIKARCEDHDRVRSELAKLRARKVGRDHQIDTCFNVPRGRLKLREGNIEKALIYYRRADTAGPKRSDVILHDVDIPETLKSILTQSLGVLAVVDKRREIYFVENVKVHLDVVEQLGRFVEIEAIDASGSIGEAALRGQCESLMERLGIRDGDLLECSYSDLLLARE